MSMAGSSSVVVSRLAFADTRDAFERRPLRQPSKLWLINAVIIDSRVIYSWGYQELTCIKNAVRVLIKAGYFQPVDSCFGRIACPSCSR